MADADPIRRLHPAVARQAGYACWTADPAIARLFALLRVLGAVAARLEALHRDRPELGADALRGEVGAVVRLIERCPEHGYDHGWHVRANGGACAGLWELLDRRRTAWIEARREAGAAPVEAVSVATAWRAFGRAA